VVKHIPQITVVRNLAIALMFDALQIIRLSPRRVGDAVPKQSYECESDAGLTEMLQRIINE
jgi:hypothetical protein